MTIKKNINVSMELDARELVALAKLDMEQNRLDRALVKIKRALTENGDISEAWAMGGRLYAQIGLFDKAMDFYRRYLSMNEEAVHETFELGMVHLDMGEPNEALKLWKKLLIKVPTYPPALFYKGLVQAQMQEIADAKKTLDILIQSAPVDNLYFGRAKELMQAIDKGAEFVNTINNRGGRSIGQNGVLPKDAYEVVN